MSTLKDTSTRLILATLIVASLSLLGQCGTSRKVSSLETQNESLKAQVDQLQKTSITQEQVKNALTESMYQQLSLEGDLFKGKITADQLQKNLLDIRQNLNEIKKKSEKSEAQGSR